MLYETKFLVSLILTLCIEVPIAFFILRRISSKIKTFNIIFVSILATVLTIPYLWFVLPAYLGYPSYIYFGEISVLILEAIIYWKLLPINLKKAFLVSAIANFSSFVIGLVFNRLVL